MADDALLPMNLLCGCVTTDRLELHGTLERDMPSGFATRLSETHPHLFADQAVFLPRDDVAAMQETVAAVERVAALPTYVDAVLTGADEVTRFESRTRGVFYGYDFHLTSTGPKLIEINTNAGGALLQLALASAQKPCCPPVAEGFERPFEPVATENEIVAMFRNEHALAGTAGAAEPLVHVAIVDEEPDTQFLRPEFELFVALFARHGITASIGAPAELVRRDGRLFVGRNPTPVSLVYLRSTDFALATPSHATLREAFLAREVTVTPTPRAHRLFADKRNLVIFSDAAALESLGVDRDTRATLLERVPSTRIVAAADRETLWADRAKLFFKPCDGFGSRAAYRGDKLTKRVFEEILASTRPYVAQQIVTPSERLVDGDGTPMPMKVDVRAFAYDGRLQFVAARLYRGQTTNMRTPHGGLAAVVVPVEE